MAGHEHPAGRETMKMKCPHCGVRGTVPESLIGKKVRCPKCKEIFKVDGMGRTPDFLEDEHKMESGIETPSPGNKPPPSQGMTAQEEANLEEELAKIFDDMKKSSVEQKIEPDPKQAQLSGMVKEESEKGDTLSDRELASELDEIIGEKCSVCGTMVGRATKHEVNGKVYCSNCLTETGSDAETDIGKDLTVTQDAGGKKESGGILKKIGALFAGILIIALIVFAGYYLTQMR